jgi:hypothetical protein
MSKPLTIASLLKKKEGEKERNHMAKQPGIPTNNRFLLLAEKGKAARDRTLLAKRFRMKSEGTECSELGDAVDQEESVFVSMEKTENQLREAKVVIDQVKAEVDKMQDPGPLKSVMDGMVKWMALTMSIQENTASVMLDGFAKANKTVCVSTTPALATRPTSVRRAAPTRKTNRTAAGPQFAAAGPIPTYCPPLCCSIGISHSNVHLSNKKPNFFERFQKQPKLFSRFGRFYFNPAAFKLRTAHRTAPGGRERKNCPPPPPDRFFRRPNF